MRIKIKGIYVIHCATSNKSYIGSSKNITKRWQRHLYELTKGVHHNAHLQKAFNLYGRKSFNFSIVEECEELEFVKRESYWIRFYDSANSEKGYNIDIPDQIDYPISSNPRQEDIDPIICIDSQGNKVEYKNMRELLLCLPQVNEKPVYKCMNYWSWINGSSIEEGNRIRSTCGRMFIRKTLYRQDFDYPGYKKTRARRKGYTLKPRSFSPQAIYRREKAQRIKEEAHNRAKWTCDLENGKV